MAEATIDHLIEQVRLSSELEQNKTEAVKDSVDSLVQQFSAFFKAEKRKGLDDAEKEREESRKKTEVGKDVTFLQGFEDAKKDGFGFSFLIGAILASMKEFVIGAAIGVANALKLALKTLALPFRALSTSIGLAFKNFFPDTTARFTNFVKTTGAQFKNIIAGIRASFTMGLNGVNGGVRGVNGAFRKLNFADKISKSIGGMVLAINNFGTTVATKAKAITKPVVDAVKATGAFLANAGRAVMGFVRNLGFAQFFDDIAKAGSAGGAKLVSSVKSFFKPMMDTIKGVTTAFQNGMGKFTAVFRTLGRVIFFPLTVIIGIVDSIKGWKAGFDETGGSLIGGVLGALGGLFKGLIGMPLDLIKNIFSWLAGKFGLDGIQSFLDGFSFTGMIGSLFDTIADSVLGFFDAMRDESGSFDFGKIIKVVIGSLFNVLTAPIRGILNKVADLASSIGFKGTAEKIRGFADGLKMDTGFDDAFDARKAEREKVREEKRIAEAEKEKGKLEIEKPKTEIVKTKTSFQTDNSDLLAQSMPQPQTNVNTNVVDAKQTFNTTNSSVNPIFGQPEGTFHQGLAYDG